MPVARYQYESWQNLSAGRTSFLASHESLVQFSCRNLKSLDALNTFERFLSKGHEGICIDVDGLLQRQMSIAFLSRLR